MSGTTKTIEVLGPGCSRCKETYRIVLNVVAESGLDCDVVKCESVDRMVELGLLATPGVAVDGRVVISGHIPRPDEVRRALGLA